VDTSLHSDTLCWQQTKQSFLLLFKVAYLVEKHQILIIVFWPHRNNLIYKR
jgi:hypothetical protein